ncbi:TetR/AcrR family transcriptional regulator, partial [Kitasatospora sp. NPDC057198]
MVDGATDTGHASREVREELRARREGTERAIAAETVADVDAGLLPPRPGPGGGGRLADSHASVVRGMPTRAREGAARAT